MCCMINTMTCPDTITGASCSPVASSPGCPEARIPPLILPPRRRYFQDYLPGPQRTVFHTQGGLSWRNPWGVLRYSANNAFLALLHSQQVAEQVRTACQTTHACLAALPPLGMPPAFLTAFSTCFLGGGASRTQASLASRLSPKRLQL